MICGTEHSQRQRHELECDSRRRQAKLFRLGLTLLTPVNLTAMLGGGKLSLNWPADIPAGGCRPNCDIDRGPWRHWSDVSGSRQTNAWIVPINQAGRLYFSAWPGRNNLTSNRIVRSPQLSMKRPS